MPWGLTRFHHSGQSHFVTFCCYHRRRLFTTDASRRIFESALERVRRSFKLHVYGYVVMPEFCGETESPQLFRVFAAFIRLDLQSPSQPGDVTTAGPSTPQIIALR